MNDKTEELATPEGRRLAIAMLPMMYVALAMGAKPAEDWLDFVARMAFACAIGGLVYMTLQCIRFVIREEIERKDSTP